MRTLDEIAELASGKGKPRSLDAIAQEVRKSSKKRNLRSRVKGGLERAVGFAVRELTGQGPVEAGLQGAARGVGLGAVE